MLIQPIILAGGSGTRLWPLSRSGYPKQFLSLIQEHTMLQLTMQRLEHLETEIPIVICNEAHRFIVAEQLREREVNSKIILEPIGRNTAPAVGIAAELVRDDSILLIMSADHLISDNIGFSETIEESIPLAREGKLITFGIEPTEVNTEYGYIKKGSKYGNGFTVDQFVEKPEYRKAKVFLESKNFVWNSGIFLFRADRYLDELKMHRPDIFDMCVKCSLDLELDLDFLRIDESKFKDCPEESIDTAVFENTRESIVVPLKSSWSDIGSWESLWRECDKDDNGNVSKGDVFLHDTSNSFVRADGNLVVASGIKNLIIVSTKDALFVADRSNLEYMRLLVNKLKEENRSEWEFSREVHRPWGKYESVDKGDGYQVKRITVKPGAKLSVQKHKHRSEHWVVVSGVAKVTNDGNTYLLSENESTYIALGSVHALENPGDSALELIEVQSGSYLGEDDIVRFEDRYGRT